MQENAGVELNCWMGTFTKERYQEQSANTEFISLSLSLLLYIHTNIHLDLFVVLQHHTILIR
jgi:hypothetical protein